MSKRADRLLLTALLFAATPGAAEAKAFFAISTPDVDRAAAWYRRHLDLNPIFEVRRQQASDPAEVVILEGELALVELLELAEARPPEPTGDASRRYGIFKAGLVVDDVDRWLARWRRDGVTISANFCWEGRPMAVIADSEGNELQVLQADPARPAAAICTRSAG